MVSASPACSWSRGKCLQQLLRHNTGGRRAHDFSRETKTLPVSSASEVQAKPGRWGVVRASQLLRQLGDRSSSSRRQRCGDSFGDAEDPPLRALDFGSPDHGFLISASFSLRQSPEFWMCLFSLALLFGIPVSARRQVGTCFRSSCSRKCPSLAILPLCLTLTVPIVHPGLPAFCLSP